MSNVSVIPEATILDIFWVVFHEYLPNRVQSVQNIYYWCNYAKESYVMVFDIVWKFVESQKTDFVAHGKRFFVYTPLHPMSYTPIFCQIKGLMKIHNVGMFHQYSICSCQVKNLKSFAYQFSIHEMVLTQVFLPLTPQIWSNFTEFFTRDSLLADKNTE